MKGEGRPGPHLPRAPSQDKEDDLMETEQQKVPEGFSIQATLTRKDLEAVFKVTGRTIDRLVASGRLPAPLRVGGSRRWRRGDIVEFMEKR